MDAIHGWNLRSLRRCNFIRLERFRIQGIGYTDYWRRCATVCGMEFDEERIGVQCVSGLPITWTVGH